MGGGRRIDELIPVAILVLVTVLARGAVVTAQQEPRDVLKVSSRNCPPEAFVDRSFYHELCEPALGVRYTVASEDGTELGSCITDHVDEWNAGACTVPGMPWETAIIVTEDVSTTPHGYEVRPSDNPAVICNSVPPHPESPLADGEIPVQFIHLPATTTSATDQEETEIDGDGGGCIQETVMLPNTGVGTAAN